MIPIDLKTMTVPSANFLEIIERHFPGLKHFIFSVFADIEIPQCWKQ